MRSKFIPGVIVSVFLIGGCSLNLEFKRKQDPQQLVSCKRPYLQPQFETQPTQVTLDPNESDKDLAVRLARVLKEERERYSRTVNAHTASYHRYLEECLITSQ